MATKKILEPKLPAVFSPVSTDDWADGEIYQVAFADEKLVITDRTLFASYQLTNVELELADDSVSEFTDCVFEKCDFSNLRFSKIGFYRCLFKNCKLLGTDFTDAHLQDVRFEHNLLRYANFSGSTLKSVAFNENDCTESFFTACKFQNVQLTENKLESTNFWETDLKNVDFSTNHFERLDITPRLAKGAKIALDQAPFFATLLGVEIK